MDRARAAPRALFASLFFLSGATGLIYELVWVRELYQFFGSTIHSVTTVVAAYMGGLGIGAYLLGRRADRHPNPALLYGVLEIAIGAFGVCSPWIFRGIGVAYLGVARALGPDLWAATAVKFFFAFVVLMVPTFLMGGTLPILTRAFAGDRPEQFRRQLALFYGINTVGGVVGCLVAGYALIEYVGLRQSLLGVGILNVALGAAALAIARLGVPEVPPEEPLLAAVSPASPDARRLATWLIAVTAFASLLYEIAWTRVLILAIGNSTYAFTTILAAFLFGIGLGSLAAIGRGRPVRDLLVRAALVQGSIAVLASLLFPFFRALPVYVVATLQVPFMSAWDLLLLHGLAVALVVVPPAVGMGVSFPLLAEAAGRRGAAGSETGRAYLANTLGSIGGAVVTGFVLIHLIGSERTLEIGVLINVGAAAVLAWWLYRERGRSGTMVPAERTPLFLGALALVVAFGTPSWSHRLLDRGPVIYGRERMDPSALDRYLRGWGAEQLRFDEGWNAAVSVWRNGGTTWLKTNGKADASTLADMSTQVMLGMLPALAHPAPARAFVVGLGSGATARTLADVPGVELLDVAEIERAVVHAAPFFAEVNRGILDDSRVRLIEDDARSALQLARDPYDLIVSEPSNPWVAGVAALYTRDYFRVVERRLAEGGVFAQWVQTYRVTPGAVAVVVANLRAVFPHVEVWYANPSDLVILATRQPIRWDETRVAAFLEPGTATGQALWDWLRIDRPSQLLGNFLLGDRGTATLAGQAAFRHSDDQPSLEFEAARSLLTTSGLGPTFDSLLTIKAAVGDSLPRLGLWPLAPGALDAAYAHALPGDNRFTLALAERALAAAEDDPERRGEVGRILFEREEFRAALPHLRAALERRPDDAKLLLLAGLATAAIGEVPEALALLDRARQNGGDSTYATSVIAEIAAGREEFARASREALRALSGLRPTIATPFPGALENTLRTLSRRAPVEVADPVFEAAARARPSWDLAYSGRVTLNVRAGGANCQRAAETAEQLPRFGWREREVLELLRACTPALTR